MTDLTRLHAHEMAALLRSGEVSSRELTEAHLAAAERDNRVLNAWLTIDRDRALAEADAADARLAAARTDAAHALDRLRPLLGIPVALKDLVSLAGGQCTAGSRILEGYIVAVRRAHHRAAARGGGRHPRQDQHGRVRDGLVDRAFGVRADGQPVGPRSGPGRQQRRLGGGRRGVPRAAVDRHRHRRLDPPARGAVRRRRDEADLRAGQPLRDRRVRQLARPDRPVCARRARRGGAPPRDRRSGRPRLDLVARAGAGDPDRAAVRR